MVKNITKKNFRTYKNNDNIFLDSSNPPALINKERVLDMKKENDGGIMLVLGLIGLGMVGVLSYKVVSEDKKIERRNKKNGRKLCKTEGDDNNIISLDPTDKILYEVAKEILGKNDPSI